MPERFYITTAIDYANGDPHFGHAFEKIGADVIARYRRLCGDDVHFLMGMDEHGLKVAQAAAAGGLQPQQLVDRIAETFERTWERLEISHDQFIRTTDADHRRGVHALIERIFERSPDDFYEKAYEGWYCVGCELFKREGEIVEGRCAVHPTRELEWTTERNWFFRLSAHEEFLRGHLRDNPGFLEPATRRNEILALIESGLDDISVSRARLDWAIPFPRATSDGERQGTWVWFDALPNYLTATGYPDEGWDARWPAQLHVVGKDITRLHCVVWPAMLRAAGLPLPERVWAHGFVSLGGERFSKSAGITLDLPAAIDRHGADALRYFLIREIAWDSDGNFSYDRFDERYTAELANDLGNLASRTLSMLAKYRDGVVPAAARTTLDHAADAAIDEYRARMDSLALHDGAAVAMRLAAEANGFVGTRAPWKLAKDPDAAVELDATLASLIRSLGVLAVLLSPYMPGRMDTLWSRLGAPGPMPSLADLPSLSATGWTGQAGGVLFPRPELAASAGA
jgi:methionyl-tRNA synthetase